jgi:hypothetical protein
MPHGNHIFGSRFVKAKLIVQERKIGAAALAGLDPHGFACDGDAFQQGLFSDAIVIGCRTKFAAAAFSKQRASRHFRN